METFYNYNGVYVSIGASKDIVKDQMSVLEENILLKKQLRRLQRQCDAYKQYVPTELLPLIRNTTTPSPNTSDID